MMLDGHFMGHASTVTAVIGIIGILIPIAYAVFVHYLSRRQKNLDRKKSDEVKSFILNLQTGYAADSIRKRGNFSSME